MCLITEPHVLYVIKINSEFLFIVILSGGSCKLVKLCSNHMGCFIFYRIYLHDNVKYNARWSFMIGLYHLIELGIIMHESASTAATQRYLPKIGLANCNYLQFLRSS